MREYRILIVEDESIVAIDLKQTLEKLGYKITSIASSGIEAIEKANSCLPDIILMDIHLKGSLNGIDAARIISFKHNTPVIYLSSFDHSDVLKRTDLTASGYLSKPFDETKLKFAIENILSSPTLEKDTN